MTRYCPKSLQSLATDIACAAGVPREDAAVLADSLVSADVAGVSTHGVTRLGIYIKRIQLGLIDPWAKLVIDRRRAAVLSVDAGNGLGQVQAMKVLDVLIPMARNAGVASATIRNSQHFGALSYFCNKAAEKDMILLGMSTGEPAMSPEGGSDARFGTNPIAVSFPTSRPWPVRIDLATSRVARGNIIAAKKKGDAIPQDWALDTDGNPTTDASKALLGTVLTMAGHKGYALATMVEGFSAILSGAAIGASVGSMYKHLDRKQDVGHFFCLFDIDAFMDVSEFKSRLDKAIDEIKSSRKRPGVNEILIPGERSYRRSIANRASGVPVDAATLDELRTLCDLLGVAFTLDEKKAA